MPGTLGNVEYPFIAIISSSTLAPDRVLSMSQIELFDIYTVCKRMTGKIELLEKELFDLLTVKTND